MILGHSWGDLPMIFTSDEVTSENHWQITSRVTKNCYSHSSLVKIIGKWSHSWPKIFIHGKEYIILFLTHYFMSWTHHSTTNKHRSLNMLLSLRTVFADLTLWRHHSWSVMSRERKVLALWHHIHQLFLHAQIGTKAIFTSWTVDMDFSPPSIHSLACKK